MKLIDLFDKYIFQGVTGQFVYALLERCLRDIFGKNIEDLYLEAAQETLEQIRPVWSGKYGDEVHLDRKALRNVLRHDLAILLDESTLSELDQSDFIRQLAKACATSKEPVLTIENNVLSEDDYLQLLETFFEAVQRVWQRKIIENKRTFAQVLLEEAERSNIQLSNVLSFLETRFSLTQSELSDIVKKLETGEQRREAEERQRLKEEIRRRQQRIDTLRIKLIEEQAELFQLQRELEQRGERPHSPSVHPCGWVYNLPRPIVALVKRTKYFEDTVQALDLNRRGWGAAIDGIGGVGKTTLAIEVAHYCLREHLFERIIWTTAQTQRLTSSAPAGEPFYEFEGLLEEILRAFGCSYVVAFTLEEKRRVVKRLLENSSSCLLIIDNLETIRDYRPIADFLNTTPFTTKVITTTRRQYLGRGERRVHLPPMSFDEVRQLIYNLCEQKSIDVIDAHIEELYTCLGGIPLAIVWSIGQYRRPAHAIDQFLNRLRKVRLTGAVEEQERQLLEFCFREAYETLTPSSKKMLKVLGLFSTSLSETLLSAK